jgi:PAS domain S-box-containing protein
MVAKPADLPDDASEVKGLARQLQAIHHQLQAMTGGEVDAIISPAGESFLLQQAQVELLRGLSEQRTLSKALEAEHQRLTEAQATARIGSWSIDLASRVLGWSEEMHRIYETDPELEPTLECALERTHPDDRARVLAMYVQRPDQPTRVSLECRLLLPGGVIKFVEQHWQSESDADGVAVRTFGTCQDISDRARAVHALHESRRQLKMATRLGRIGAWSANVAGRRIFWSDEVCALFEVAPGTSPSYEEVIAFFHPDCRDAILKASLACEERGTPFDLELELTNARGRRLWVRCIGEAVRDAAGTILEVEGAFQDLSDRKRAEQETQRLATRLTHTLESLTLGFLSVDRDWRLTYFNAAAERLLGRRREQVLGRLLWDEIPQFGGNGFERSLRSALERNRSVGWEAEIAPGGPWLRAYIDPSERGLTVHLRDVTLERTALRKLQLLESAVARINDVILITEATPVDEPGPRIQYVNDAFARMTGFSASEVLNRSPRLLQGPETDPAELRRIHTALEQFEPVRAELVNYTKAGTPYWVELEIVPIAEHGTAITHFVAIERDISVRKRDQQELERLNADLEARVRSRTAELELATQTAEQANRAKSTFLATMSHEIRTPMNGVVALVDVLAHTRLPPSQAEMVGLIRESADSLLQMIDDMLDFSKIEAGKLQLEAMPMRLGRAFESACALLDPTALSRDVSLTFFVDPRLPATVLGDELRWRQILLNLLTNAIKFSAGRATPGRVAVRVELLETREDSVTLELQVADNGIGIDGETIERLFTPFSQADHSTTRRFGGTGLGLAISSELVRLMGGTIGVQSEPERGSVFTVRLPFDLPSDQSARNESDPRVSGLHCLIVGGELPLAEDLARYLEHGGARVTRSPDSASAAAATPDPEGGGREAPLWIVLPDAGATGETGEAGEARGAPQAGAARRVVLGHGGQRRPRNEAPGVVRIDVECLSRSALFKAIAFAAQRLPPEAAVLDEAKPGDYGRIVAPFSNRDEVGILVAEDLETNRMVMERQLGILGLKAEFASDGRAALELWRSGRFALLFTDLRMPELDGYGLTARIRAEETPGRRTAILALTANALPEEAARCRAAGMDDYLVKPVRLSRLQSALEKWLGNPTAGPGAATTGSAAPHGSAARHGPASPHGSAAPHGSASPDSEGPGATGPIDLRLLASLIGDDPAGIRSVLARFRGNADRLAGELRAAIRAQRPRDAVGPAHTLKSGARAIGARRLGDLCEHIEQAGESEAADAGALTTLGAEFDSELEAVIACIEAR